MQLDIFNKELVKEVEPTFDISFDDIYNGYFEIFKSWDIDGVNIVFVKSEYIHELNMKYRGMNAPTDVLSFSQSDKQGEIYISPEFVYTSFKGDEFEQEILRLIIHGTLHILGYDHKESMNDSLEEEMFRVQEELLLKYIKICS
ncbi:MAG TPA: rRNA maturation RNase YbeY [Candidatus Dojkabacteria bacterium]|nr:rRNA maturation RNase YbeY [Candidatus Dojkabacteria bacterium]